MLSEQEQIEMCLNCKKLECNNCLRSTEIPRSSGRPIKQISPKTGKIIAIYDSIIEASKVTGISKHQLSRYLRGKSLQGFGYEWEYVEKE